MIEKNINLTPEEFQAYKEALLKCEQEAKKYVGNGADGIFRRMREEAKVLRLNEQGMFRVHLNITELDVFPSVCRQDEILHQAEIDIKGNRKQRRLTMCV